MKAWTDYPIIELSDEAGKPAPVRECRILSWDRDKYCRVVVSDVTVLIKTGYLYRRKGRYGEVPWIRQWRLWFLPRTRYG